ncbi:MAG: YCF48-related protein, partial [Ignavibacteriaceae bacterium]|nr:YCF48-related protein [Ignavibacteriaceae bacterium]
ATGAQKYVIMYLDPSGQLYTAGELDIYNCNAVFGGPQASYVGQGNILYIIYNGGYSSTDVGGLTHIEVRGNLAYIINNSGLHIWDVTNNNNPFLLGSVSMEPYPEDLYVVGHYAFVSHNSYGLKIYDVQDPTSPVLVGLYDTYTAAVESVIKDNIAYVTYTGDGLLMIDISNLEYPVLIGQYENSSYTYDLKLRDNLVYLTCWEDGFKIIDVSDPTSPSLVSVLSGFNAWMVEIYGNYAYVEELNPPNTIGTIRIINIADPSNPFEVSSIQIPSRGYKLVYHNGYLFVADYDSGLRILDVSDPQNPFEAASLTLPDVLDIYIRDNDAFVCSADWPSNGGGFYDFNISNLEVPVVKGYYGTAGFFPFDVSVADTFAYVSDGDDIWLFLLTESDPVYIEQYRLPDLISSIFSADKYIYISDSKAGLSIYKNNLVENPPITNWEVQTSGITQDIWAVDFTSLTEGWAAADQGILLHTTNGGDDWQIVPVGGYFDDFRDITFVNENTGWVCGENSAMYKTTNGGQTWTQLNVPTTSVIRAMCFLNESLGWVVTLEDHLILKTTDGGDTWTEQNSGLVGNQHHFGVCFTDENNGFVIGFILTGMQFDNYILKTTNGGQTWDANFNFQGNDLSSLYFVNHDVGWIGGLNGLLIKTTDAGETWYTQNSGVNEVITGFSFTDESKGWYSGFNGVVFQTNDGGNSWVQQEVLIQDNLRAVDFVNEANGWVVGSNGTILHYYENVTNNDNKDIQAPTVFVLSQNYPNPFNPTTTIQYSIPESGNVSLRIYNALGEEVANLVNEFQQPGIYKVNFYGENLSSGIYFYRLNVNNYSSVKKMILLK